MDTGDEGHVIIAVIRHVVEMPVCGERLGALHLLASPPQVRQHVDGICPSSCVILRARLESVITELMSKGYRVELRPIERPVSYLEFMMLDHYGKVHPDKE